MGSKIKAIFFDLGETLVTQNIEDNMVTRRALKEIAKLLPQRASEKDLFDIYRKGYRVNHSLRSRHLVEIPVHSWMRQLLRNALGGEPDDMLVRKAISIIVSTRAANAIAFNDAKPTLETLSKHARKLSIISNVSSHEVALRILERVGLGKYFDTVVTSAQTGIRKPDPGIFLYALMELGLKPHEAMHVGDSEVHDVRGAKATGIGTVLVSRRTPCHETIADYCFRSLSEATAVLKTQ